MGYVYSFLGWIMDWCYGLCGNYGWAIVLFTFITKIILLPLSLWTYFKGITMIKIQPDINFIKVKYYGQPDQIAEEQAKLFKEKKYSPLVTVIPTLIQLFLLMGVVGVIRLGIENPNINMSFGPVNLGAVPAEEGVELIWSPIIAGFASFVLCIAQNKSSVLQAEQSKLNKRGITILSVGLSLYLGWFVAVGTAFYWVCSNLFAVLQLYICNWIFKPRQYVDYERLEESRRQLAEIQDVGKKKRERYFSENRRKERADYKRFFSVVNKHLVFYSESNGFYKYFKGYIEYLLENTNLTIHYITSDPDDNIFELEKNNSKIRAYYIGENKLITLMMKMDADVVCMTMPDLENFHIKRSYVRDDVEYIYIPHSMGSSNLTLRPGAQAYFDTMFIVGPHNSAEHEAIEKEYGFKKKKFVNVGFPLLDDMRSAYSPVERKGRKQVLIAPSWQANNIMDSCIDELIDSLKEQDFDIIVRPHPQYIRHYKGRVEALKNKYKEHGIEVQTDFSTTNTVWEADLLITDWSDITIEYSLTTFKPTLCIDTPMKVMNPDYKRIDVLPINIEIRNVFGKSIEPTNIKDVGRIAKELLDDSDEYRSQIMQWSDKRIFNPGHAAEVGGKYLIETIQEKIERKKNNEKNN